MIKILKQGLITSIQDLGRPGYFHLGIPVSGAMDRFSMKVANMMVGNDSGAAVLEAVFMGPKIEFITSATIAVTGADIEVQVDGQKFSTWTAIQVTSGQVLSFGTIKSGARIYIAIAGGIEASDNLGSKSTYAIGALGGVNGRPIAKGDILQLGAICKLTKGGFSIPEKLRPRRKSIIELRVLPGLYWHRLEEQSKKSFFNDEWKVGMEINRMGYRFKGGTKLQFVEREQPFGAGSDPSNIVDSCYSYGSIQVPGGIEPIILHRDAVSGGGYFTLGAVISADMDSIGQLQPNEIVKFVKVTMKEALQARKLYQQKLTSVEKYINTVQ
jgi:urea carboxylase